MSSQKVDPDLLIQQGVSSEMDVVSSEMEVPNLSEMEGVSSEKVGPNMSIQ